MKHWVLALGLCLTMADAAQADGVVNVYSDRRQENIEPLFKAFTKKTGIEVRATYESNRLVERLEKEGDQSPADLMLTNDVGRLVEAADKGLAQPVTAAAVLDK